MTQHRATKPGAIGTYVREVTRDAATDGVAARWAWILFWMPAVGVLVVGVSRINRQVFRFFVAEDHLLEWAQFGLLLSATVFGILVSVRLFGRGEVASAVLFIAFSVGTFLVAGEEISWGQRLFGWGTPSAITVINNQGETNLHNILEIQNALNYLKMVGGLIAFALPFVTRWSTPPRTTGSSRPSILTRLSPALFLGPCFLLMFGYRFIRLFALKTSETAIKFGEWPEFALYFGFAAFAYLLWRRLGSEVDPASATRATPSSQPS